MQAWRFQLGQYRYETVDGPWDPIRRQILRPPVPSPPALADSSVSWPRNSRGPSRRRPHQTGHSNHNMVVDWTGRVPSVSQHSIFLQSPPAARISTRGSYNVDAVPVPDLSLYATNMDLYQQRLGQSSASVSDASELSDFSRTLHNTPCSSRNSSISAMPDAYLPARNFSYRPFRAFPGSPHPSHISSVSNTSNSYIPANSRNQSGSSHMLQGVASDEACKIIVLNVRAGVTPEEISNLLDEKILYVQHDTPKRGERNRWSVNFSKREVAEKAKEELNGFIFNGRKLRVHLSNSSTQGQISSGASTTSTTSSTITPGPTIVDGSVTG